MLDTHDAQAGSVDVMLMTVVKAAEVQVAVFRAAGIREGERAWRDVAKLIHKAMHKARHAPRCPPGRSL